MKLSRREFLGASSLLGFFGLNLEPTRAYASIQAKTLKKGKITTTICPYCAVGCSSIVTSVEKDGKRVVINSEGDPDHPINEGALCPKGASLYQLANNEKRLNKVLYRAAGSTHFEEKDWGWAAKAIAKLIKKTRDASFTLNNAKNQIVNRTTAIASVGSAALDNEECWLYQKMLRSLGIIYIEHQARI